MHIVITVGEGVIVSRGLYHLAWVPCLGGEGFGDGGGRCSSDPDGGGGLEGFGDPGGGLNNVGASPRKSAVERPVTLKEAARNLASKAVP